MSTLSRKDVRRHTPARLSGQADAPVYLIRPVLNLDRMLHGRDVSAAGSRYATKEEMHAALRKGIETVVVEEDRPALLALVEADQTNSLRPEDAESWAELERVMIASYPPVAALVAARQLHLQMSPYFAFRRFVTGWENCDVPLVRSGDLISEETMQKLNLDDVLEVGWVALLAGRVTETDQKNSPSPSPSGDNQPPSGAGIKPVEAEVGSSPV